MSITVLLVDNQELLRSGLRMVLEEERDIKVVGEAGDGETGIRLAGLLEPDVVLMELRIPGTDSVEAARRIMTESPATKVLILTALDLDGRALSALSYGVSGFLFRDVARGELTAAIRTVAAGEARVTPRGDERFDPYVGALPVRHREHT